MDVSINQIPDLKHDHELSREKPQIVGLGGLMRHVISNVGGFVEVYENTFHYPIQMELAAERHLLRLLGGHDADLLEGFLESEPGQELEVLAALERRLNAFWHSKASEAGNPEEAKTQWDYVFGDLKHIRDALSVRDVSRVKFDVDSLWGDLRKALAALAGAKDYLETLDALERFENFLEQLLWHRHYLLRLKDWNELEPPDDFSLATEGLKLAKEYLDNNLIHVPWMTNYLLSSILDLALMRYSLALPSPLGPGFWGLLSVVTLIYFLPRYLLPLAWLAIGLMILHYFRRMESRRKIADGIRAVALIREEIASDNYDAAEVAQQLHEAESRYSFYIPSLVYPLLRLSSKVR